MTKSKYFVGGIWFVNAFGLGMFYLSGTLELFLVAVGAIIIPTVLTLLWEVSHPVLRRYIGMPIISTLVFFAGILLSEFVIAGLKLDLPQVIAALALELFFIWWFFLYRPRPPGGWNRGGGGFSPCPPKPYLTRPLPAPSATLAENSLAWRKRYAFRIHSDVE